MEREELGMMIRQARKKNGFTMEKLAEKADIGVTFLGEIERGKKMPSLETFIRLVEAMNVSSDYILRNELTSGKEHIYNDITKKLDKLSPRQRKTVCDIIDVYIKNL